MISKHNEKGIRRNNSTAANFLISGCLVVTSSPTFHKVI